MFNKILDKLKKSKGFLTKRGSLVNYKEVHALGLGLIDGFGFNGQGYRLEFWLETHEDVRQNTMHYYSAGYSLGRFTKYIGTALTLFYLFGIEALKAFLI